MWDGVQEELLKKIGEEHAQYEFMKSLASKCGYFLFSREHVHAMTKEVLVYKDSEDKKDLVAPSLQLAVVSRVLFVSLGCVGQVLPAFHHPGLVGRYV